jgi:hypothetical protein
MLFLTDSWQKIWPSSSKPASIKYFKDHNFMFLLLVLMPVRQYMLCTAKTAQKPVRIIGALEYLFPL